MHGSPAGESSPSPIACYQQALPARWPWHAISARSGWLAALRPQFHADRRWRGDFTCGGENGVCRFLPLARAALSLLIRLFVPGIGSRVCAALEALAEATGRLHCARASFQVSSGASR